MSTLNIGIYGEDLCGPDERHGCGLWPAGMAASIRAAEANPVILARPAGGSWGEALDGLHGVIVAGPESGRRLGPEAEQLCNWCQTNKIPILGIDQGLHILNQMYGGTIHQDVSRELPEALQHRHPPERGLRHAINVVSGTFLARIYGEGEVVVNSEHRRSVQRVARGFRVCAHALDGVIEAIEFASDDWFAIAVQWQPASATSSGLDIQLFRGLINASAERFAEALCPAA